MKRIMRTLLPVLCVLLLWQPARPDFVIPIGDQVSNSTKYGCCVWASLEMLGHHLHIKAMEGLLVECVADEKNGATVYEAGVKLDTLNVKYLSRHDWWIKNADGELEFIRSTRNFEFVRRACQSGAGCVVFMHNWPVPKSLHAIVLSHYDEDEVRFYDPNDVGSKYQAPRSWFDRNWSGGVIYLNPDQKG